MVEAAMANNSIELPAFMLEADRDAWLAAVAKALKGGDISRLTTTTRDGIRIEPLGTRETAAAPLPGWRASPRWQLAQREDMPVAADANRQILTDLEGGADALDLVFSEARDARGFGLDAGAIDRILDGVLPDLVTLRVSAGEATPAVAASVRAYAAKAAPGVPPRVVAAFDPVALALGRGGTQRSIADLVADGVALAKTGGVAFVADGRVIHAAGGTDAQELAYVLSTAVHYWRALAEAGMDLSAAAGAIGFTLTADVDQFATIAKFRALRLLWALAQEEAGIAPRPALIHGETAWRVLSTLDVHTNILRATIAAFAAGVGGADSMTVLPFTSAAGLPDAFARRIARNTQLVLLDESNLYRVTDPGAGAGAIEAETQALAARAWDVFKVHEAGGGIVRQVQAGVVQTAVAVIELDRARDVARRKVPLTGVSEFPDLKGEPAEVLAPYPAATEVAYAHGVTALPERRLAEPFEALRAASAAATKAGRAPRAFVATLGPIAEFTTRATWVKNLVEAAGIEAPIGDGYGSLDDLLAAYRSAGTPLAVIASSDAIYEAEAEGAAAALKAAGASTLIVAGKPADEARAKALEAAGVTGFVFAGMDVVATLRDLQAKVVAAGAKA